MAQIYPLVWEKTRKTSDASEETNPVEEIAGEDGCVYMLKTTRGEFKIGRSNSNLRWKRS